MKLMRELTVKPWAAPKAVYTEEGVNIPLTDLTEGQIAKLCRDWLEEVTGSAGVDFDFKIINREARHD